MERRRFLPLSTCTGLLLLIPASSISCGLVTHSVARPGAFGKALTTPRGAQESEPERMRSRLMRFADFAAVDIQRSTRAFAERAGTQEARLQALLWQVEYTQFLWKLASGPKPYANLFDSVLVISAIRRVHETRWIHEYGEADRVVLDTFAKLEDEIWKLAAEVANEERIAELRRFLATWLDKEGLSATDVASLPSFLEVAAASGGAPATSWLLSLVGLDPLSGLEPAVAEVEQARLLAERTVYYYQQLPELLSARAELLAMRSIALPESRQALADWQRFSEAAAKLGDSATALSATIAAEREAAIAQLSDEITAQREGLIRDLEAAREPLTALLHDSRGTAEAGRDMSQAIEDAVSAADELAARLIAARGERLPARPFDITEYAGTAESVARAARDLTTALQAASANLPQLARLADEAGIRAVDHAFRRALQLLAVALVGAGVTALLVRRISARWGAAAARHSGER